MELRQQKDSLQYIDMKKIITLIALCITTLVSAQAPEGINYQAVIRDNTGGVLLNTSVGIKISILQGSATGTSVYEESFTPTTSDFGLVNLVIGQGTAISGDFTTIDWSNGPYFMELSADETGGTSYALLGTQQLMSVPYALHAKTSESALNDQVNDADADPTNEIQDISLNGTDLSISSGSTVDLSTAQIDSAGVAALGYSATMFGDIKQGFQFADHGGWYLLDGRAISSLPANAQNNAVNLGFVGNIPDASNKMLANMGALGATGGSSTVTLTQANLPNATLSGTTSLDGTHTHTVSPVSTVTNTGGAHNHAFYTADNDLNYEASQGYPANDNHDAFRTTDRRQRTEDNGTIQDSGTHTHNVTVPTHSTNNGGQHSHTVSVSTGGSDVPVDITPAYLSTNVFIYLGE